MFEINARIWPAGDSFRRAFPDRVEAVGSDGQILVSIYPDGSTYNGAPLGRSIGWRSASDYVLALGYVPTRRAYGYVDSDPRSQV